MNSNRTTNALLFVIAISLVTIAAKPLLISIFPEAQAQYGVVEKPVMGCYMAPMGNGCTPKPILVDAAGKLIIGK